MPDTDVLIIGGGPAGLAAAIAADKAGSRVLLLEREARLGGILKQCIHDGFGLVRFGEKLTGPEYAERFMEELEERGIPCMTSTFVTDIQRTPEGITAWAVNREGITQCRAKALVLATGCRERTARQVSIHGTRPAGIFTAGTAQHFTNLLGELPARSCVVLGSGDIGLIMARRLTLEGAQVLGVYEAKSTPSGLTRNLVQCLEDFHIPLFLSHTVTRVFGEDRLEGVEIAGVDEHMNPIQGTEQRIACDALILSVGLIPENEMAEKLGIPLDRATKGPVCDNRFMTGAEGVFSCGNALHVNDLVDYVSESGEIAGRCAAEYAAGKEPGECSKGLEGAAKGDAQASGSKEYVELKTDTDFLSLVPQRIQRADIHGKVLLYFRSREVMENAVLCIRAGDRKLFEKKYAHLRPPEMERLELELGKLDLGEETELTFSLGCKTALGFNADLGCKAVCGRKELT